MNTGNKKMSYAIRAAAAAAILLVVYLVIFFMFADLESAGAWVGFGFSVFALLATAAAVCLGVTLSDSLQTAMNFYDSLQMLWIYPVLTIAVSVLGLFFGGGSWKLLLITEMIILAVSAIAAIIGGTAARRMTELDEESRRLREASGRGRKQEEGGKKR